MKKRKKYLSVPSSAVLKSTRNTSHKRLILLEVLHRADSRLRVYSQPMELIHLNLAMTESVHTNEMTVLEGIQHLHERIEDVEWCYERCA